MKLCLMTRFFDFRNAGLGRVAMKIRDGLIAKGYDVSSMSVTGDTIPEYVWYSQWHCHFKRPPADIYHALTPVEGFWLPRSKSVVTYHDMIMWTNPERCGAGVGYNPVIRRMAEVYWRLCFIMSKRCQIIVCVSEDTRDTVRQVLRVPDDKLRVIRSGISEDVDYKPKPAYLGYRFGYLGQLDKRKRIPLAIEAFKRTRLDAELVIGGMGRDEERLKAMACNDPRIKFLGLIPDDQLCDFYNSLDWFVFPTWMEGYGLPIVEAMACKKPVVVLEDALIPSDVKDRCLVVTSMGEFMSLIKWGLTSANQVAVSIEDNYQFAKSHRWDTCVNEYEKIYHEVKSMAEGKPWFSGQASPYQDSDSGKGTA